MSDRKYSILCADDDPEIQSIYKRLLEKRGYEVRGVSNGALVMSELKRHPVDLILMDARMPVMSGIEATEKIRTHPDTFNIPIIFVSGYTQEDDILKCLNMGGTDFVCKPFEPNELLAKIKFVLRKHSETFETDEYGLPVGARVAGRYEIRALIDSGGFSNVYLVRDITDPQRTPYALKVFNFPYTKRSNRQNLYTILREAYQLCKLDHPCIVKAHDFGQYGSIIYIVLEYIDGQAVDVLVNKKGALNEPNSAFIGFQVGSVLEYLDKRCMIHRDIKPDNIMITQEGDVKLVDFGLAKQAGEQTLSLKRDEFRGTAQYVSPEYVEGEEVDIMSDVYSLGTSLYFMSTGQTPFSGTDLTQILYQQVNEMPPAPKVVRPQLSLDFSDLVMHMLAKAPKDRPHPADIRMAMADILSQSHHD